MRLTSLLLALTLALGACNREPPDARGMSEPPHTALATAAAPREQPRKRLRGKLDSTFYVTADTHFGFGVPKDAPANRDVLKTPLGIEKVHRVVLDAMRRLPGRKYPPAIGGTVATPRGVLVAGDLTESGQPDQWQAFLKYYGSSKDLPLFEAVGNHDFWPVRKLSIERHGALWYSWDWDDLHVVCLGEAPGKDALAWLEQDLGRLEPDVPVVVFMHFPLLGPYSDTWFTREGFDDQLRNVIAGHNIAAIFHGHYHGSGRYKWHGYDVYNVGSAKHQWQSFAVVHVTEQKLSVAAWDYSEGHWKWWHHKSIGAAPCPPGGAPCGGRRHTLGAAPGR